MTVPQSSQRLSRKRPSAVASQNSCVSKLGLGAGAGRFEASGKGTVYSYTVPRRGAGPYREAAPFVVAYVELEEGPRIMTNLVDIAIEDLAVGMPVEVVWHDTGQGNSLYRFRPAS
jgi:uncharacterized OB-fold protein